MNQLTEQLAILGLTPKASQEEAEAAYRDLIRVWHPDRFVSDPRLRAKAQEQTVRINRAMSAVRDAFKNPAKPPPNSYSSQKSSSAARSSEARQPSAHQEIEPSPTLIIHQPFRASMLQILLGCAMFHLGIALAFHFSERDGAQTALSLALVGYGFSTFLGAVSTICFKTPIITINRSFLHILGAPYIPVHEVIGADVILTRHGLSLTILCSSEYVRQLLLPQRWAMRVRQVMRGYHFEFNSKHLDHDPRHVIRMLNASTAFNQQSNVTAPIAQARGRYTHAAATLCLSLAVVRCLTIDDYEFRSLMPYLILFALLRSVSTFQTALLANASRTYQP